METTILETCKNRKRKPTLFGFQSFAGPGSMMDLHGPFRENIRLFLQECGEIQDYSLSGLPTWTTLLISETNGVVFPLYTIEETVQNSLHPFCDHCKCIGWSHHFVSKRRYHLIIPGDDEWNKPFNCNNLQLRTHLLHGLIHCNGFGHLLCINGLEIDSKFLIGSDIMDLWDRICTTLQTRKISVNDISKKKLMELRLVHGVAYGSTWFGKWGYKFWRGSFGITEDNYNRAIGFLGTLDLDKIINDFKNKDRGRKIEQIVDRYREVSETQLIRISDLLQFMLGFKSRSIIQLKSTKPSSRKTRRCDFQAVENPINLATFVSSLGTSDCRWSARRLEYAVIVIVKLLKEKKKVNNVGKGAMSRQELRNEARQCVGDTGLIDFVLKSITCVAVGNQIIYRSINPLSNLFEFWIDDAIDETELVTESYKFATSVAKLEPRWPEKRLEQAAQVIVRILRENKGMNNGNGAMPRQELREAARQCIGDTGLIDFVLKSIHNSLVGNQIICRSKNPSTKLIEFAIRDENVGKTPSLAFDPGLNVYEDVLFLYNKVLLGYPELDSVSLATRVVLDSKYFVKEWIFKEENTQIMTLTCKVLPSFDELETELTRPLPPGELVMVPPCITISELKVVAQCALRDTYCLMERFVVRQIGGLKGIEDERMLSSAVESGAHVWVRGCGLDLGTKLRYEGGPKDWTVDCVCGARDDDGERMVICDVCKVWQHTRCSGIDDDQPVPSSLLLCVKCRASADEN